MIRKLLALPALALLLSGFIAAQEIPNDLMGLSAGNLNTMLQSRSMTLTTSSYRVTNPTTGAIIATVTVPTGQTGYILGYRAGGTASGYLDLYTSGTNAYQSLIFGADEETGWQAAMDWHSLSATAGTTLSIRAPIAFTGVYTATILVGKVNN